MNEQAVSSNPHWGLSLAVVAVGGGAHSMSRPRELRSNLFLIWIVSPKGPCSQTDGSGRYCGSLIHLSGAVCYSNERRATAFPGWTPVSVVS